MLTREEATEIMQRQLDRYSLHGLSMEKIWKTIEVPCGWYFLCNSVAAIQDFEAGKQYSDHALIGNSSGIVNHWTRQVDVLGFRYLPKLEAYIRDYISKLPVEQRIASEQRFHLLPYEPVRFFPPILESESFREMEDWKISRSVAFSVELDEAYFASKGSSIPELVVSMQWAEAFHSAFMNGELTRKGTTAIVSLVCEAENRNETILHRQYRCVFDDEKVRQHKGFSELLELNSPICSRWGITEGNDSGLLHISLCIT